MRIFGIDPGSQRTGYGCVDTDGRRHRLVVFGSIAAPAHTAFPERLLVIHAGLAALLAEHRPDCVAIENIFHAKNVRSALKLGHARGVALLAASAAGVPIVEYTPAEIKRAVVGFGRAEKHQVGQMVKLLLGLDAAPSPHDAADAVAVAICHIHSASGPIADAAGRGSEPRRSSAGPVGRASPPSREASADRRSPGAGLGRRSLREGGRHLTSWRDYRP